MRLYAISVDPPDKSRPFIEKIEADGKGPVSFQLLADPGSATIDAYGLRDPAYQGKSVYGIPRPAVFILDRKGIVRWARIETDFRVRPPLGEVRAALDAVP